MSTIQSSQREILFPLYTLVVLLFMCAGPLFAQESAGPDVTHVAKINFLNPGLSYEHRVGKNQTVKLSAFMNVQVSILFSSTYNSTDVYIDPAFGGEYRYYYNLRKRSDAGKRIEKNSANYLGLHANILFSKMPVSSAYYMESNRRAVKDLGIGWGMQRNYKKHFSLDLNLGVRYRFGKSSYPDENSVTRYTKAGEFIPGGNLTLGFWLN